MHCRCHGFMNSYFLGDFAAPTVTFSGPATGVYYNTDKTINFTVTDTGSDGLAATGVAGFSQAWDSAFSDPTTEPNGGVGNSFYSGPEYPNQTSGSFDLAAAGARLPTMPLSMPGITAVTLPATSTTTMSATTRSLRPSVQPYLPRQTPTVGSSRVRNSHSRQPIPADQLLRESKRRTTDIAALANPAAWLRALSIRRLCRSQHRVSIRTTSSPKTMLATSAARAACQSTSTRQLPSLPTR